MTKFEIEFINSHIQATTGTVEIEAKNEDEARELFRTGEYDDKKVVYGDAKQLEYQTQVESIRELE